MCECSKKIYNEKIEKALQNWMTFLMRFLEITNIEVIRQLKNVSKYLFSKNELHVHFSKEVRDMFV